MPLPQTTLPQTTLALPEWAAAQDPAHWLAPPELAQDAAWTSVKRRAEWRAGRFAAKRLVRDIFGLSPLAFAIGRDGDAPCLVGPDLPPVILSLSHSAGLGAATFSDPAGEGVVGLDVQQVRPVHPGLAARVFTTAERAQIAAQFGEGSHAAGMLLLWALKEAAIKTRRRAWGRSLREIEVELTADGKAVVRMPGEPPLSAAYVMLEGGWWLARAVRPPF